MRRIAVINQKGGVGKTTTSVNIGAALARAGHRVLMIDLDPQAHLTLHLGLNPADRRPGVYELLTGTTSMNAARTRISNNLWVVGASIDLAAAEVELVSIVGREVILRDLLAQHTQGSDGDAGAAYDYVIMDCPPSLGVLTLNGLCAAREVVLPLQPHYLALQGLSKLFETVSLVGKRINPELVVTGVAICMKETGTRLGAEVIEDVRSFLDAARNTPVPWRDARVFDTCIRRNIKLAEAPSYGQSIFDYAADSNGAKDYEALAAEIHDPAGFAARGLTGAARAVETVEIDETVEIADASGVAGVAEVGEVAEVAQVAEVADGVEVANEAPAGVAGESSAVVDAQEPGAVVAPASDPLPVQAQAMPGDSVVPEAAQDNTDSAEALPDEADPTSSSVMEPPPAPVELPPIHVQPAPMYAPMPSTVAPMHAPGSHYVPPPQSTAATG